MGGSINMAFRFSDGEAVCHTRWTNGVSHLCKAAILNGDESIVRDYIAEDADAPPSQFRSSEYGFILIDFQTRTILDINSYTSLFQDIHNLDVRDVDDPYFSRKYRLLCDAIQLGFRVKETAKNRETVYEGDDGLRAFKYRYGSQEPFLASFALLSIDAPGWTIMTAMNYREDIKTALAKAREIDFPFTKKDGLNSNR